MHYEYPHARKGRSPALLRGCNSSQCRMLAEALDRGFVCTSRGEDRRVKAISLEIFNH